MKKNVINNTIYIEEKYLPFRDNAKRILSKKRLNRLCYLDFSNVEFMSRGFIDELLNNIELLQKKKITVKMKNLKPDLKYFINKVKLTKKRIKAELNSVNNEHR